MLAIACACAGAVWVCNAQSNLTEPITADGLVPGKRELLHADAVLESGTFWLAQKAEPPWPFLPPKARELGLPVYWVEGSGMFPVDDRSVDYAAVAALEAALRAAELELGLTGQTDEGPPVPGEGEIGEDGGSGFGGTPTWQYGGLCLLPPVFGSSNSISLTITNAEPGAAYDLSVTTNLSPDAPGLNLTNWGMAGARPARSDQVCCHERSCRRELFPARHAAGQRHRRPDRCV